jgi:integrase
MGNAGRQLEDSGRGRLTALKVERAKKPGMYGDGGGLYLQVTTAGARSWIFRYRLNGYLSKAGKPLSREMGLGSLSVMGLADARTRAAEYRRLLLDGVDPLDAKRATRARHALSAAKALTFAEVSENYITAHRAGWRNPQHAAQWSNSIATYVNPICGSLLVSAIDTAIALRVLEPIWTTKTVTAGRVRGRAESILDFAKARGLREGENPFRWRGHLDKLLPPISKIKRVEHHAALPYSALGGFMGELRDRVEVAARALEFLVLTAARTNETLGARWDEINIRERLWTVPGDRMKAGREHRVPLSAGAIAVLERIGKQSTDYVFSDRGSKPPYWALDQMRRRMGRGDAITVHGFRAAFRTWAAERTAYPREIIEQCLAHRVGDAVEQAYQRSDQLEKRRRLMSEWSEFCSAPSQPRGEVVPLHATSATT